MGAATSLPSWAVIPFYILGESAVVLIINAAGAASDGKPSYNTGSLVMVQEVLKLCISLAGLAKVPGGFAELRAASLTSWLKYGIPGLLYSVNNNLFHHVLAGNMPAAFQVLLQLRALWTGLMFWWILKRRLSNQQWAALGVLCVGAIVSQSKVFTAEEAEEGAGSAGLTVVALLLTLLYTWISVGAGVYNELLLKTGGSRSIHLANVPLYMWGVALNLLILAVQGSGDGDDGRGFWAGWEHASTWVLMVLQSFIGLGVSVVMKRFDNVVKILCVAASNVVVYLFGVVVMGYEIEASFAVGGAMVMAAAYAYTKASVVQDGRDPAKRHGDASPSTPAKPA